MKKTKTRLKIIFIFYQNLFCPCQWDKELAPIIDLILFFMAEHFDIFSQDFFLVPNLLRPSLFLIKLTLFILFEQFLPSHLGRRALSYDYSGWADVDVLFFWDWVLWQIYPNYFLFEYAFTVTLTLEDNSYLKKKNRSKTIMLLSLVTFSYNFIFLYKSEIWITTLHSSAGVDLGNDDAIYMRK